MTRFDPERDVEEDEEDADEDDEDDGLANVPAVLASLLLCMCCPTCEGTGTIPGKRGARCPCRALGHDVAIKALKDEGLIDA